MFTKFKLQIFFCFLRNRWEMKSTLKNKNNPDIIIYVKKNIEINPFKQSIYLQTKKITTLRGKYRKNSESEPLPFLMTRRVLKSHKKNPIMKPTSETQSKPKARFRNWDIVHSTETLIFFSRIAKNEKSYPETPRPFYPLFPLLILLIGWYFMSVYNSTI